MGLKPLAIWYHATQISPDVVGILWYFTICSFFSYTQEVVLPRYACCDCAKCRGVLCTHILQRMNILVALGWTLP